jgi:hypothetical protein
LYFWWRALERPALRSGWLAAAIAATTLGLLAKQTMLAFFPATALFLVLSRSDRATLRHPMTWAWGLSSLTALIPVLWWNAQHDWLTVRHTSEHFGVGGGNALRNLFNAAEFLGGQAGLASPLIFALIVLVGGACLTALPRCDRRSCYLLCFGALPLAGVALLSFTQRVQPNWPAPFYGAAMVLLAGWAAEAVKFQPGVDRYRTWFKPGLALGAVFAFVTCLVPFSIEPLGLAGTKIDTTARLRGWKQLGEAIGRAKASLPRTEDTMIVMATDRSPVSEVAFYAPGNPRVYRWNAPGMIDSQHEVWGGPTNAADRDALIVTPAGCPVPADLTELFQRVERREEILIPLGKQRHLTYQLWYGVASRAWPTARAFSAASNFR